MADENDIKARLKTGCIMSVVALALMVLGAFLFMLLGIPTEFAWLWWLFLLVCSVIAGWITNRKLKGDMEKNLGRKLEGKHELTSLKSWIEASKSDDSEKPK